MNIMKLSNFTIVNNDANGNPRYVCHFLHFIGPADDGLDLLAKYDLAVKRAKIFGGKIYRGKDYGGGIVFTSNNINDLIEKINFIQTN